MAVGAFSSIVMFKGFSNHMIDLFENSVTRGQYGHVQIAKAAMWDGELPENKEDAYIAYPEELRAQLAKIEGVENTGARASAQILISNGDKSTGALALGFDNKTETNIEASLAKTEGTGFTGSQDYEILVGSGLQKQLHLKVGQTVTLVSQTLKGSMSSVEPEVRAIVSSGVAEVDNSVVFLPIGAVQKLLGTSRTERITVLLKPSASSHLPEVLDQVRAITKVDPTLVVKSFKEIATLYQQTASFYRVQNLVVELILSCLVFFGILNTVGMSIYERIGELGTMRALGDQSSEVLSLLLLEGFMLGAIGSLIGVPLASLLSRIVTGLNIPLMMPGASLPLSVHLSPKGGDYVEAAIVLCITCLVSSFWPAFKSVRMNIVDALRANS
jgi:putative ABC transport system permease protein